LAKAIQQSRKVQISALRSRRPRISEIHPRPSLKRRALLFLAAGGFLVRPRTNNNKIHQLQPDSLVNQLDSKINNQRPQDFSGNHLDNNRTNNQHRRGFLGNPQQIHSSSNKIQLSRKDNKGSLEALVLVQTPCSNNQVKRHLEGGELVLVVQVRSSPMPRYLQAVMPLIWVHHRPVLVWVRRFSDNHQSNSKFSSRPYL
jgi:hypothetical protein